ncbi:MAG TPA: hypothetical protein EYP22_08005 [Methanosarcinales archaeon]|nr:hypothetical protein [Methanosarcinales archaeon]
MSRKFRRKKIDLRLREIFKKKEVLVDTGPLLIHATGFYDKKLLPRVSSQGLDKYEFDAVAGLFSVFKRFFITPYVLCEWCAHIENKLKIKDNRLKDFIDNYKEIIFKFDEINVSKEDIINSEAIKFGFTDASVVIVSEKEDIPILTIDNPLIGWCQKKGLKVVGLHQLIF